MEDRCTNNIISDLRFFKKLREIVVKEISQSFYVKVTNVKEKQWHHTTMKYLLIPTIDL